MEANEKFKARVAELGPDYLYKKPPLVIEYDTDRLQRRAKNEGVFRRLKKLYQPIPEVTCGDCGHVCCRASPDFYLVEYLQAWRYIRYDLADPALEAEILHRCVRWAFLSFIDDVFCPFLFDGRCVIYEARPLNCRVWGLENPDYYAKKAERAAGHAAKQEEFFAKHGVALLKPLREFILPKCGSITVHAPEGATPLSEEQVLDIDFEVAFLHKSLIRPEEFRSLNFTLHFPGHVALKRVPPEVFDETRIRIAREFQQDRAEHTLRQLIRKYEGKLP